MERTDKHKLALKSNTSSLFKISAFGGKANNGSRSSGPLKVLSFGFIHDLLKLLLNFRFKRFWPVGGQDGL
jgi:hypothetical protein